ncbi:MAG TPA: GAF domain-containing sensor histidine kinase, partial [Coleofasciculaceae cyanobacterium]
MAGSEHRIYCRLDGLTPGEQERKRLTTLQELGLLDAETIPVFDEATQTAARFLHTPICILSIMTQDKSLIKSAFGLSRIGLMNHLAQSRQLPRDECFCTYVVDSQQVLAIEDTASNAVFASSLLVGHYGIRAYLGAPLLTVDGDCLGTLAVMDLEPHHFTDRDIEFLAITARWSLSEFERNRLLNEERTCSIYRQSKASLQNNESQSWALNPTTANQNGSESLSVSRTPMNSIQVKLIALLTQELRTPLTSVMGMASVLSRQVYGPLTNKQKEYLEIIHRSGQYLVSLVEEIVSLGLLNETAAKISLVPVDIEMLCQQAINNLNEIAQVRQQQMHLSIEPGHRIWLLDKDKVRQILYYLVSSVLYSAEAGGEVRIHVFRKSDKLNIAIWVSHPWLGDGLPPHYGGIAESLLPAAASVVSEVSSSPFGLSELDNGGFISGATDISHTHQLLSSASL